MYHRFDENKYPSTNIKIEDFKVKNEGSIQAYFKNKQVKLNYQKIYNHYLVYICQNKPKNEDL